MRPTQSAMKNFQTATYQARRFRSDRDTPPYIMRLAESLEYLGEGLTNLAEALHQTYALLETNAGQANKAGAPTPAAWRPR